jgi:hypothetical protein
MLSLDAMCPRCLRAQALVVSHRHPLSQRPPSLRPLPRSPFGRPPPDPFGPRRTTSLPSGTGAPFDLGVLPSLRPTGRHTCSDFATSACASDTLSRAALRARPSHLRLQTTDSSATCRSLASVNTAPHEHTTNIDQPRPRPLASCLRRVTPRLHVAVRFRCFVQSLWPAGTPAARGGGYAASCLSSVLCTRLMRAARPALTPTRTTARPGGFTPAGGRPDTSCRQLMLEPVWKSRPSDGAVDRLRGNNWPYPPGRSRTAVGLPDESRRETRTGERYPRCLPSRGAHPKTGAMPLLPVRLPAL